jgi:hypothetical protein
MRPQPQRQVIRIQSFGRGPHLKHELLREQMAPHMLQRGTSPISTTSRRHRHDDGGRWFLFRAPLRWE